MYISTIALSQPDTVTVCEGEEAVFTCKFTTTNASINSNDAQWYRLIKDTSVTVKVHQDSNIHFNSSTINNTLTSDLTITNASKSHTGYYWVRLPSDDVCNVSLTVTTSK